MIKDKDFNTKIIEAKKKLRSKSNNFEENFFKISKFIEKEIDYIQNQTRNKKTIIPEVKFKDISDDSILTNQIKKRGCIIVRDIFDDNKVHNWNKEIENYIDQNNYYEHQKEKIGLDNYFSDLKSGKPQIYGIYWSKPQIQIRQSIEIDKIKKWLNNIWKFDHEGEKVFDPNREIIYADRIRRREPGDASLGLSPHCDAGSVERWIDEAYQKIYEKVFSDDFENFDPFDAKLRDKTKEIESPAVAHVFRTFQGWVALTKQGPKDGTLQLIPIAKGMAYILTRALLNDVKENELCGSKPGKALSINNDYHSLLLKGLVSIPILNPGDAIWWHPDVVHAVEDKHLGNDYSNVIYIGSSPYCEKNFSYGIKQSEKFLKGESPTDFAAENYEVNYTGRATAKDLTSLGKKQLILEDWN